MSMLPVLTLTGPSYGNSTNCAANLQYFSLSTINSTPLLRYWQHLANHELVECD